MKKYRIYQMTDLVDIWYQIKVGYFFFYWWVCEKRLKKPHGYYLTTYEYVPMFFESLEEAENQIKIWKQMEEIENKAKKKGKKLLIKTVGLEK